MPDRKADRHAPGSQVPVSARLDKADFDALEATRGRLGIRSRRQAIITAIREWLDRHEPAAGEAASELEK